VDFSDPERRNVIAGGHEQSRMVWKSTDGGQTWTNVGLNLPEGTKFSSQSFAARRIHVSRHASLGQ